MKIGGYDRYVREARAQYAGFKLFYRQDVPLMSAQRVLGLEPTPDVVIFQYSRPEEVFRRDSGIRHVARHHIHA